MNVTLTKPLRDPEIANDNGRLLADSVANKEAIKKDPAKREEFLRDFDALVARLRAWKEQGVSTEESAWLREVATRWQDLLPKLHIDRYVRRDIGLFGSSPEVAPERRLLTEEEVREYLTEKANEIGETRKLQWLLWKYAELKAQRNRIHSAIPSTHDEMDFDWRAAKVCFALEVLDGRIDFSGQVGQDVYPLLESVWLEDAKCLKAFIQWEDDGEPWDPQGRERRYFLSCEHLRSRAFEKSNKAPTKYFDDIADYIEQSYLSQGRIDPKRESSTQKLVEEKSHRVWQRRDSNSREEQNWSFAETYVKKFYEHVIPAVQSEHTYEHIKSVCKALCDVNRSEPKCDIVNCFEAAVVIYHFDAVKLKSACDEQKGFLL